MPGSVEGAVRVPVQFWTPGGYLQTVHSECHIKLCGIRELAFRADSLFPMILIKPCLA